MLYDKINQLGINVSLDYSPIETTQDGNVVMGRFREELGSIEIYVRAHDDIDGVVDSFAHEARHAIDFYNGLDIESQYGEYRAFVESFIVSEGRVPTRSEMGAIAQRVNNIYDLPSDARFERILGY